MNQTYSETVGRFNEWGVNALVVQESFVYLEKIQSTPGAEGGREAPNNGNAEPCVWEKGGCTILDNIDFLAIYYSYISIKNSI